jgi:adenylate cyclase, class 2
MEEFEVKFLNIDPEAIQKKLEGLGATRVFEKLYRRCVYDYSDLRLNTQGAWVRLRDEGDKVTLNFKQRLGMGSHDGMVNDAGMDEVEFTVSDFEKAELFLTKIGLQLKGYQENHRIRYVHEGIEYDFDYWPKIPPYLEIEAESWEKVEEGIRVLGLPSTAKKICSTTQIYAHYGIDINSYIEVTFERMVKK